MTSVQFVIAVAFSLVFTAGLLDVAVVQYATGAVHSALEEGARAGARHGAGTAACERAAAMWLGDVLGGERGRDVVFACADTGPTITAHASGAWEAWLPGVPPWPIEGTAIRRKEVVP